MEYRERAENLVTDVVRFIENSKLNVKDLRDIVLSIVMFDFLEGSNEKTMDVDMLYSSDVTVFTPLWKLLGFETENPVSCEIPVVQGLRVISDMLFIYRLSQGQSVEDFSLANERSYRLANLMNDGHNYNSVSYMNEDECEDQIKRFLVADTSFNALKEELYKYCIEELTLQCVKESSSMFKLPESLKVSTNVAKAVSDVEFTDFMNSKFGSCDDDKQREYARLVLGTICSINLVRMLSNMFKTNKSYTLGVCYCIYNSLLQDSKLKYNRDYLSEVDYMKSRDDLLLGYMNSFFNIKDGYDCFSESDLSLLEKVLNRVVEMEGKLNGSIN